MIPIIAWRNIWRNRTRSWVVIGAIALGVWAAIAMSGFATGMARGYVRSAVDNIVSHIQIHHPEFKKDFDIHYRVANSGSLVDSIAGLPEVKAVTSRTIVNGMISSAKGARGIQIKGIDPEAETGVTGLNKKVDEGEYFDGSRRNEILISHALAEKLQVKLRAKMVLTFQDLDGEITTGAFRVVGLFDTGNKPFDEYHIFMKKSDLTGLLVPDSTNVDLVHEIAILLNDPLQADEVSKQLQSRRPELLSETYRQISPDLQLYESQINIVSYIYLSIIMLALVFGIINTMLMAVLERIRELGMLMAIGMNKWRVFSMIVLEALLLGVIAAPLGLMIGWLTIYYIGTYGLDMSMYSESLKMYGLEQVIYFEVLPSVYYQAAIAVIITAFLASIYPAWKAVRLQPVEAIRKI